MDVYEEVGCGPRIRITTILAILMAFASPVMAADIDPKNWTVVPLKNGINRVDLNGDGVQDMVIKSWIENYNAHGSSHYNFFVGLKSPDGAAVKLNLVPFTDQSERYRYYLGTHEGADCRLAEVRLVRDADRTEFPLLVIYADRTLGESYVANERVTFSVFELKHNKEGIVGWATYYFQRQSVIEAKKKYCDVDIAFKKELGLK